MENLGVEINQSKTHRSERMFEFAKRLIIDGIEVSAYPLDGLIRSSKFYLTAGFLLEQEDRGYPVPPLRGPGSIEKAVSILIGSYRSRLSRQLARKAFDWLGMTRIITSYTDPILQYTHLVKWASIQPVLSIPCRPLTLLGVTPILKWTGMMLYKSFGAIMTANSRETAKHYALWRGALMRDEGSLQGCGSNPTLAKGPVSLSSGTGSFSLLGLLPPIGSVARLAHESAVAESAVPKLRKVDEVYPQLEKLKAVSLPSLSGVNPMRKKDIILGTRAEFSRKVASEMLSYTE